MRRETSSTATRVPNDFRRLTASSMGVPAYTGDMGTRAFVFILLFGTVSLGPLAAQAPPAQPAQPAQQRPARPPVAAAATPTVTIQVTNSSGLPLANVQVTAQGPVSRDGVTAEDGSIRFANMRAGAYRLRFMREGSITLDRDITVRAGEPLLVDVALSAAPAAPKPVEPAPAARAGQRRGQAAGAARRSQSSRPFRRSSRRISSAAKAGKIRRWVARPLERRRWSSFVRRCSTRPTRMPMSGFMWWQAKARSGSARPSSICRRARSA